MNKLRGCDGCNIANWLVIHRIQNVHLSQEKLPIPRFTQSISMYSILKSSPGTLRFPWMVVQVAVASTEQVRVSVLHYNSMKKCEFHTYTGLIAKVYISYTQFSLIESVKDQLFGYAHVPGCIRPSRMQRRVDIPKTRAHTSVYFPFTYWENIPSWTTVICSTRSSITTSGCKRAWLQECRYVRHMKCYSAARFIPESTTLNTRERRQGCTISS